MRNALLVNSVVFGALFGLHILAAAMGWTLLFSFVAGTITLHVLLFGPLTVLVEASHARQGRRATNRAGFLISLPLALGLAWAFGGMAWSPWHVGWILTLHLVVHGVGEMRFRPSVAESEMAAVGGLK